MNLNELIKSTVETFPLSTKRQNAKDIVIFESVVAKHSSTANTLLVTGQTENSKYTAVIEVEASPSEKIGPHHLERPVKVSCTCHDFRHTFASYNFDAGILFGEKPEAYKRVTDTRPARNPLGRPGMCKHLLRLTDCFISPEI